MIEKESVPFAPHLIESMRSLGYSFETAIADLIDNSVSADSKNIDIYITPSSAPKLIILDDGCGMTEKELEEALRYGAKNPLETRNEKDLGRFGLGLKSASLSQCRKLVVASKKNGLLSAFSWDLDFVIDKKGWVLLQYGQQEIKSIPMIEKLNNLENGTIVLLEKFDRVSSTAKDLSVTINDYMNLTIDHISLVFHRFLEKSLVIRVNNNRIEPLDPFLSYHPATTIIRTEEIKIDDSIIKITPYILPHMNKLTKEDVKKVGSKEDLKTNQGFYIYRNKRLIIYGTWFRLTKKSELSKLARVKVDIPNTLDDVWNIDIKKTSATLPDKIKRNLYASIKESIFGSTNVHEYRGRSARIDRDVSFVWDRIEEREGNFNYKINRELPVLKLLESELSKEQLELLNTLLDNIEELFPKETMYLDYSKGNSKNQQNEDIGDLLLEMKLQIDYCKKHKIDQREMVDLLMKTEPYSKYSELREQLIKMGELDE